MLFVDVNIFLEIQLSDERSEECKKFLRKIASEELPAATSDYIVYSCLLQISNKLNSAERMEKFIASLSEIKDLTILNPDLKTILTSLGFMKRYSLDFDDALVVSSMIANKIKKLVSFDKHFDKVKEIERIEPGHVL